MEEEFDISEVDHNGNTIFHLLAMHCYWNDTEIPKAVMEIYGEEYQKRGLKFKKNNDGKTPIELTERKAVQSYLM